MAQTEFGVNHALAVKRWSTSLAVEAEKKSYFKKFIGTVITKKTDLEKNAGDKVTYGLRMKLRGAGVTGDNTLEGNEEALTYYDDAILIDQLRHAVRSKGKASEQRVPYKTREEGRDGLSTWWAERFDELMFVYLSGARGVDSTLTLPLAFTSFAGNSLSAPDAAHIQYANGLAKATITAADVFTLSEIDKLVEKAETVDPMIQPIMVGGEKKYIMLLHPYQVTDLRTNTATGQWQDIQKAAAAAQGQGNPIFTGALGEYNGVILHKHRNVIRFSDYGAGGTFSAARALFLGAQAGTIAFGNGQKETGGSARYSWVEELFDYKNQLGVAAGAIFGIKKAIFNSKDFGVIACDTYAAAH
jgi:N4-gp56 family major capsid protein